MNTPIQFAEPESVKQMEKEEEQFNQLHEEVEGFSSTPETDARSIYVGNVDYAVGAEELAKFFAQWGTVTRVTIPDNYKGEPKGYAFLEYADQESVQQAVSKANNTVFKGRPIKVR